MVRCYTKQMSYYEWLKIKDKFVIKVKKIVENAGASFAFHLNLFMLRNLINEFINYFN